MKLISVKIPEALLEGMDRLVEMGLYPSRSAVMRTAVRDLLKVELWSAKQKVRLGESHSGDLDEEEHD